MIEVKGKSVENIVNGGTVDAMIKSNGKPAGDSMNDGTVDSMIEVKGKSAGNCQEQWNQGVKEARVRKDDQGVNDTRVRRDDRERTDSKRSVPQFGWKNKNVMVTGATGLIGQAVVRRLVSLGAHVTAVVREAQRGRDLFADLAEMDGKISFVVCDITKLPILGVKVDYIIHGAACTSSKAFVQDPVGVAMTSISGTTRVLELARISHAKGLVYLSSMEVYGTPAYDSLIDELHATNLNTMRARSSYPESKRMCECLCASYCSQYGVPAKVLRLAQTFGPGVRYEDGRVFAEFARCVIEGRDIVLHTQGETMRSYLYTEDAAEAILKVLMDGKPGEAYNAANEETYCSIYDMAQMVAKEYGQGKTRVLIEGQEDYFASESGTGGNNGSGSSDVIRKYGYVSVMYMNLDTRKLRALGWQPTVGLKEMYGRLIKDMAGKRQVVNKAGSE